MVAINGTDANNALEPLPAQSEILLGPNGNDTILGSPVDDVIEGNPGSNYIKGQEGNDSLYAGPDEDTLLGGPGNDVLVGKTGNNLLYGNEGSDFIYGIAGNNILFGNQGNDWLVGGENNDIIYGGQDEDTVFGGNGDDLLYGDKGNDTLLGNEGNDTLYGEGGNNLLYGNRGNDLLVGNGAQDTLYGGQDDDTLSGGDGNDLLSGDKGNDILFGKGGNDSLYGGEGDDQLFGDEGNNWLNGNGGNDSLYGGDGNDTLYVEEGNNFLAGGGGNDLLVAGFGSDRLIGGEGSDRIVLERGTGSFTRSEANLIVDFTFGEDEIELINELRFENLNFIEEGDGNSVKTIIQDKRTGEYLAILQGVRKVDIEATPSAFIEPPPPPDSEPVLFFPPSNPIPPAPREVFVVNETTPLGAIPIISPDENSGNSEYSLLDVIDSEGKSVSNLFELDAETGEILLTNTENLSDHDYFEIEIALADSVTETETLETYRVYTSIQTAIAEANEGDTIVVSSGTYSELLEINKGLTIKGFHAGVAGNDSTRGTDETMISTEAGGTSIRILASNVTLDGIETNGDIIAVQPDNGTAVENLVIQNVRVFDALDGINLEDAATATVENNLIQGSGGIVLGLFDSNMSAIVRNNILESVDFGILGSLSESEVADNQVRLGENRNLSDLPVGVEPEGMGIKLTSNSENVTLANNAIENAPVGIVVEPEVTNAFLENNSFSSTPEEIRVMASNNPAIAVVDNQPLINIITGSSAADSLQGTDGNDLLFPGDGVDTLTGGKGQDIFVYATVNSPGTASDRITDFTFGSGGDAIAFTENLSGVSGGTPVTLSKASLIDGTETVIVDTQASILAITSSNARIGYASDTGKLYIDDDGDFTSGAIARVDLGTGNVTADNIMFLN
ncbi:right-handed parallel beta-helix repeat-containing protein [Laspinema olomoucense]|uniref:right-handed parallel beta-helix repeat-containing protein n=1 Tax=Laspinema olomoucense TaxID=3231600 RepID=UPI0021BB0989|nr:MULTISPECIES: right-handed parallel beta-helix repeat-containing protein [unclassified Laspinema]MCT7970657.1 right-handed parallel beta-helix repeat-containing protein [Laspinema sp. D3d]MCT7987770.1 right-handed parallel beta-helix repeat-containing protein [Laspinema sp. D3a]